MARKTLGIYNEMICNVKSDEERAEITNYMIRECRILNDHFKEDAGELSEHKRYWTDKGDRENEMKRNEVANSILRLITMYDGIIEYMIEMGNWWGHKRTLVPIFENFYNGPENSVFMAGAIGYSGTTAKKRLQTRLGLMELEQITQYLSIAGGKLIHFYYNNLTFKLCKSIQATLTGWRKTSNNLNSKKNKKQNLINSYAKFFQTTSERRDIQDLLWTPSSMPSEYPTLSGKKYSECKRERQESLFINNMRTYFSDKMEMEIENHSSEQVWKEIHNLVTTIRESDDHNLSRMEIIKRRVKEKDISDKIMKKEMIKDLTEEIINICKSESLPTQNENSAGNSVKHFPTMEFQKIREIKCYCTKEGVHNAKPECSILKGGAKDMEYYNALAHEIGTGTPEHRGITLTARFDVNINKKSMLIPLMTIWDLYRILAKIEGIEMEHILPISINNSPSYHNNSLIIRCKKEHRDIMSDVGNTILTIWPQYLEIVLGRMGKFMPLELHISVPKEDYNKYSHASTSLMDFQDYCIHKYITYPGIYYEHRKINARGLRMKLEMSPGITPNILGKVELISDLIKAGNRAVKARVVALAGEGIQLTGETEDQVKKSTKLRTNSNKLKLCKNLENTTNIIICKNLSRKSKKVYKAFTNSGNGGSRKPVNLAQNTDIKPGVTSSTDNTHYLTILLFFFRIKMYSMDNSPFTTPKRKDNEMFPMGSPHTTVEITITREYIKSFQEYRQNISEEDSNMELTEILDRISNGIGTSKPEDTPFRMGNPFQNYQSKVTRKLRSEPKDGDRYMTRGIRLEWTNIAEHKQEAYIGSILEVIQTLAEDGERARLRMVRQGCDSNRTKEIQFKEPSSMGQFLHIGKILQVFYDKPEYIANLPYPPVRTHLDIAIAGNSVDREHEAYGIVITIRNPTVSTKSANAITKLVNDTFPALNGARLGKWIGKTYLFDENRNIVRMGAWQTTIHGKMAEWILATGRTALTNENPLKNQICFEEFSDEIPVYCTQCRSWGNHKALEAGLAGCSAPGICIYCNEGTSRYLYKQHVTECENRTNGPSCTFCKKDGKDYKHSPESPAYCDYSKQQLREYIIAKELRQTEYNQKLKEEISRRILIKGGNPAEIFEARRDIWKDARATNTYMALMEQIKGMEDITSKWEQEDTKSQYPGNTYKCYNFEYAIVNINMQNFQLRASKILRITMDLEHTWPEGTVEEEGLTPTEEHIEDQLEEDPEEHIEIPIKDSIANSNFKTRKYPCNIYFFRKKWPAYCRRNIQKPTALIRIQITENPTCQYTCTQERGGRNNKERINAKQNNAKRKKSNFTKTRNLKQKYTVNLILQNISKQKYMRKILLRSGDIEENPGPGLLRIPEPMILEETRLSATLEFPEKQLYNIEYFNFEEFLLIPRGIIIIKEKLHNHIYSCPPCDNLNNCLKKFLKIYIKKPIPLSNAMIAIIVECLQCVRCAYCLKFTKFKPNKFLPMGFICNQECESKYMNEFICTYSETERGIVFHPEHRTRALWIKHLGLKTMNNIGRIPTCEEHFTYRTCITDCLNVEAIKAWIEDPENNLKERKKRAKKRIVPHPDANHIIELILNLAGGAICAGEKCGRNLWLYKGESEYDHWTGLQYCSRRCINTRIKRKIDCHKEKVQIIRDCIKETYHLNQKELYQELKIGGSSLLKQLSSYTANNQVKTIKEKIAGKILEGTAKITTWNMQGAVNIDQAIQFLNKNKPAILCLQETRLTTDNQHTFQNKYYRAFQDRTSGDIVTFIRKDIKAKLIDDIELSNISYMILEVHTEGEKIHIANVYAREGKLHYKQLRYLTEKYKNIIILGDLNAKHDEILTHTQKTRHNRNGLQLKVFLEGKDKLNSSPANVFVHNINDESEWTHTTHDGKWAQIDYIISHLSITHKITETQYEYMLISDHQGISVKTPELFPETHTLSKNKFIPDWRTYDPWKYKYLVEIELDAAVATGNWYEQPLHKKIEVFTNAQRLAFHNSIQFKQVSNRGGTKPRWLIKLIQHKRRYQNGLRKLASDTRKKREEAINTILNAPNPNLKFHYSKETFEFWEKNQKNFRTEIHRMSRKINRSIIKINKENWENELQKLGELEINKAPKEFYSTIKRLSGLGRNSNGIRKMEYNNNTANTEEGIANLMAQHAEDSFKPLEDDEFNYFYFQTIIEEWSSAQEALNQAKGGIIYSGNEEEDKFTWNPESTSINNKMQIDTEKENFNPNLTKHQTRTWGLDNEKNYKKLKEPLPAAPKLTLPVDEHWNENQAHSCKKGKEELEKASKTSVLKI